MQHQIGIDPSSYSHHAGDVIGHNEHWLLALIRRSLERDLVSDLDEFVSVGSTQNRELTYTHRIHMLCPIVIDSDNVHMNKFNPVTGNWIPLTQDPYGYHVCKG